jgi:hypothetical protein
MSGPERVIQSPATRLRNLLNYNTTQMVYVAAKLGIADHLATGPLTADELAARVGAHPRSLYRLLRALTHVGVFAEDDDRRFRLTPTAELLRSDAPGSLRAFALSYGEPWWWNPWGRLLETVHTGSTAFDLAMDQDFFTYLDRHPEAAATFNANMTSMTARELPEVVTTYDFAGAGTLVDVGGGHGAFVTAILQRGGRERAVLFDRPAVIAGARAPLEAAGVVDRCSLVEGDFFDAVPAGGDTYTLKDIIHDWDDERAVAILRTCRAAMAPGAKLLLIERVLPPGGEAAIGKMVDVTMMVLTGGMERTEDEYRRLLEQAGFTLRRAVFTHSSASVLEAVPA